MKRKNANILYFSIFFFFLYIFFDIGNPEALRQGTEGFYLQIAKEMFHQKSWLTPYYLGEEHWSKPPLHFWLANILFSIFSKPSLLLSRLSTSIIALSTLFIFSRWASKKLNHSLASIFLYLGSSLFFLKYSRIYMMEISLTMLTTISSCYLYDYFLDRKRKHLIISALFCALSVLVKGPVSLVMISLAFLLFSLYEYLRYNKLLIAPFAKWFLLSITLSSVWFILCYLQYGQEFIDYFFLRENLGKFESKPYPLRSVFQGLILYGLPWSIPTLIAFSSKDFRLRLIRNPFNFYVFISFLSFFSLWLIPSQRSHHYAVPAIPFFLLLGFIYLKDFLVIKKYQFILLRVLLSTLALLGFSICSYIFISPIGDGIHINYLTLFFSGTFFLASLLLAIKPKNIESLILSTILLLGTLWSILIPSFSLPFTPAKIVKTIGHSKMAACVRKPYFVKEALGREIGVLNENDISTYIKNEGGFVMVNKKAYLAQNISTETQIIHEWPIWRRGIKLPEILRSIDSGNLTLIQDTMVLIKSR